MKIIGVTGGIGAGKSTIVELAHKNFPVAVIYTDDVAREQMKKGGCSYTAVVQEFGKEILDVNQEINRAKLAQIVFSDKENVKKINAITHPNVKHYTLEQIKNYDQSGQYQAVLVETALLFEAKFDEFCDETWFVWASEETRRARLIRSRNYSNEKIDAIFEKQDKEEFAKKHCTHVIINEDSTNEDELFEKLRKIIFC